MLKIFYQIAKADTRFLIEPTAAARLSLLLHQVYQGKVQASDAFGSPDLQNSTYNVSTSEGQRPASVKLIKIRGVMTMEDQPCAGYGTETLGHIIQQADADSTVDAIVLDISSPGGESRYTETLASIVKNTSKPVVAYANQMAASAAYWVASAADEIMISGDTAEVGSIGTVLEYYDWSRYLEKEGVDLVSITASKSTAKRKYNFNQPTDEDKQLIRESWLDPINEVFLSHVQRNRPGIAEAALSAEMYIGQEAMNAGLADSVGTLQDAIIRAAKLSQTSSQMNKQQKKSAFQKGVAALRASLNLDQPEVEQAATTDTPAASEQGHELEALQNQITQLTTERDQLQADLAETKAELASAETMLQEQQDQLQQLTQEVARLSKAPAKEAAAVMPKTEAASPVQPKGKYDPSSSSITQEALEKYGPKSRED